jgi:predicted peroxiredoxin
MRDVKRLAIVIADDNPERFRTALVTAAAHVALGGAARLFFQGAAVRLLRAPINDPDAERQSAAGLPTLVQLFEEATGLGIRFAACQSSLALLALSAADFDPRIDWSGMIGFLSTVEPGEQLITI